MRPLFYNQLYACPHKQKVGDLEPKHASLDTALGVHMVCYQAENVAYMVKFQVICEKRWLARLHLPSMVNIGKHAGQLRVCCN